jgi:hypothetical protein
MIYLLFKSSWENKILLARLIHENWFLLFELKFNNC